jgi:hypothetical protein
MMRSKKWPQSKWYGMSPAAIKAAWNANGKQASEESKAGWVELRKWLRAERERILKSKEPKPLWFAALTKHIALLSEQPCEHFGAALLRGDSSELREAMDSLAIPSDSWVLEEAVIAQIRVGCALNDEPFKATLSFLTISDIPELNLIAHTLLPATRKSKCLLGCWLCSKLCLKASCCLSQPANWQSFE